MCPLLAAQCKGVALIFVSQTFTAAPFFNRIRTQSSFPEHVAKCKAVLIDTIVCNNYLRLIKEFIITFLRDLQHLDLVRVLKQVSHLFRNLTMMRTRVTFLNF